MSKDNKLAICHDCGVMEGEIHHYGCDMERCPFCDRQLLGCGCIYYKLNLDCSPGTKLYKEGPTPEQEKKWLEILEKKGRIPYLQIPNLCGLCGENWPELFMVSDSEWDKYVVPQLQGKILCQDCYEFLKRLWPDGWKNSVGRKEPE